MPLSKPKASPARAGPRLPVVVPALDPPAPRAAAPRIALYSHDTQGLGHIRRNLLISRALCREGVSPVILLLSGLREASAFAMPAGVDCLTLPSLGKDLEGRYRPRSLGISMDDLIRFRSEAITTALQSFQPDVLVVDKVPRGICRELVPGLAWLRARGRTQVVLGLREILDDPAAVRREWIEGEYDSAIRTYYDQLWVYGDPKVFDTVAEYGFPPDIAALVRYCGYLNPRDAGDATEDHRARRFASEHLREPYALCLIGGGQDGLPLAEAFLRADLAGPRVMVTGPRMPTEARAALHGLATMHPDTHVLDFVTDPCPLLAGASRVVAMGGYNTVCEIMAYRRPALIVPRIRPRSEQMIRATRLAEHGLVDVLHPDDLSPAALARWLSADAPRAVPRVSPIDFGGVSRLPDLLEQLLAERRPTHAIA